jgi:hypothetical protein
MTEIKIDRNFTFVFYDNAGATPDICFDNHAGFYRTEESTSISIDQAKQLIAELTKFIEKNTNA